MKVKTITADNIGTLVTVAIRHLDYSFEEVVSYDDLVGAEREILTESEFLSIFEPIIYENEEEEEDLIEISIPEKDLEKFEEFAKLCRML